MCRKCLSSPRCRSELIDSAWVVIVPGEKCIKNEQELQLSMQEIFRIERVLKKTKNQVFVKWKGYTDAFNSWVPLAEFEDGYR